MVVTMELKHVILRGKTYTFRILVPKDCVKAIGKTEIVISLKTKDPLAAKASAARHEAFWTEEFKKVRTAKSPATAKHNDPTPPDEDSESFRQGLIDQMEKNLPAILKTESDIDLQNRLDCYEGSIIAVKENSPMQYDFPEIGVHWPFKPSKSPGFDRARKRILREVLQLMCEAVAAELGFKSMSHNSTVGKTEHPIAGTARQIIEFSSQTITNVNALADALRVSRVTLFRCFKERYGISIKEYIEQVRFERIQTLLKASNLPICDVARMGGFTDPLYFSRAFRKCYGMSPSQWRAEG